MFKLHTMFKLLWVFLIMSLLTFSVSVVAAQDDPCPGRDLRADLTGEISPDGTTGIVTNIGPMPCVYEIGMASYQMLDGVIDNQVLFSSSAQTVEIAPNQSITLNVSVPTCATQVDLFFGPVLGSLNGVRYGARLLSATNLNLPDYCLPVDPIADADQDTIPDAQDNCPLIPNTGQENLDGDAFGDVCDDDVDGDLYLNINDCAPRDPLIHPGAQEIPGNGIDENCDGADLTLGTGDVQITLSWGNNADVDLHVFEPNGTHIWYADRGPTSTGGQLDIDANFPCGTNLVYTENVFWPPEQSPTGTYIINIQRSSSCGFTATWHLVVQVDGAGTILDTTGSTDQTFMFTVNSDGTAMVTLSLPTADAILNTRMVSANANARACPQLSCDVVTLARRGSVVNLVESVDGEAVNGNTTWWHATVNGQDAYIHSSLLRQIGSFYSPGK